MPLIDLAQAGGWKDPSTLFRSYQPADAATLRRVALEAPKLQGQARWGKDYTSSYTGLRVI